MKFSNYNIEDAKAFSLGKTYKYNINKAYIHLYYNNDNITFQTPVLFIPYNVRVKKINDNKKYEYYYLESNFLNKDIDPKIEIFESWLQKLENIVFRLLKKRQYLNIKNGHKNSILKYDDYRQCNKMILKINSFDTTFSVLEKKNKRLKKINFLKELITPCHGLFIITIQSIWINMENKESPTWGINYIVDKAQILPSHIIPLPKNNITEFDFEEDDVVNTYLNKMNNNGENNVENIGDNIEKKIPEEVMVQIAKFKKLLKMGVPKIVVEQKMTLQNLDIRLLDNLNIYFEINGNNDNCNGGNNGNRYCGSNGSDIRVGCGNNDNKDNNINLKTKNTNIFKSGLGKGITGNLLQSVVLKKQCINITNNKDNLKKKIIPTGFKTFSLNEIINCKKNLSSVNNSIVKK